jgi:hypothetical protein
MGAKSSSSSSFSGQVSDAVGSAFDSALSGESTPTTGGLTASVSHAVSSALSTAAKASGRVPGNPIGVLTSGTASAGRMFSAGLQTAGGAFGAYQGIAKATKGEAQNVTGGIGTALMSAAAFTGSGTICRGGWRGHDLGVSLHGYSHANRQKQVTEDEIAQTYVAPTPINVTTAANGMMTTTDYWGKVETLDALPSVSQVNQLLGFDL